MTPEERLQCAWQLALLEERRNYLTERSVYLETQTRLKHWQIIVTNYQATIEDQNKIIANYQATIADQNKIITNLRTTMADKKTIIKEPSPTIKGKEIVGNSVSLKKAEPAN